MASNNKQDNSKKPTTQKQPRRRLFIILGIIVALALVGGVIWFVLNKDSAKQKENQSKETSLTDTYHQALETSYQGDYQKAQKTLDEVLEKDKTKETKTFILSAKTGMALDQGEYQEAYELASKLNNVAPGFNSYQLLAKASLGLGDKEQALDFFKSALATIEGDDEFAQYDRAWLQSEIDEIEGSLNEN